jgi:septal ring factor EnvC (AmiA/AmiB activator)
MLSRVSEFLGFLLGSLKMSEAVLVSVTAVITTVGLAVVNKLMNRPGEQWKQAADMREELRRDLDRAKDEVEQLRTTSIARDQQFLEVREQLMEMRLDLKQVTIELADCHSKHQRVEAELAKVHAEFKTCIKAGGSA